MNLKRHPYDAPQGTREAKPCHVAEKAYFFLFLSVPHRRPPGQAQRSRRPSWVVETLISRLVWFRRT